MLAILSNEQIISWAFGWKEFMLRQDIFIKNCSAIVDKNNKVLVQKIINQTRIFLLVTNLDNTSFKLIFFTFIHFIMRLIINVTIFIVYFPSVLFSQYFNGIIKTYSERDDSEQTFISYESVYEAAGWTYDEFKNQYTTAYFCNDTLIAMKNIGLISENILLQIANDVYFYSKEDKEFYLANINEQSIFADIENYTKTGENEIISGHNTTEYFSYVDIDKTAIKFSIENNYIYPSSIKLEHLFDMYFHELGLVLKTELENRNSIRKIIVRNIEQKKCNCKSILTSLGFY